MPDELFRAAHFHNSAPNSNIVGHAPHFYSHIGAGHKGIKPLMCKHNVVYDLLTLAFCTLYIVFYLVHFILYENLLFFNVIFLQIPQPLLGSIDSFPQFSSKYPLPGCPIP